jgi:hypothetical protein
MFNYIIHLYSLEKKLYHYFGLFCISIVYFKCDISLHTLIGFTPAKSVKKQAAILNTHSYQEKAS